MNKKALEMCQFWMQISWEEKKTDKKKRKQKIERDWEKYTRWAIKEA